MVERIETYSIRQQMVLDNLYNAQILNRVNTLEKRRKFLLFINGLPENTPVKQSLEDDLKKLEIEYLSKVGLA